MGTRFEKTPQWWMVSEPSDNKLIINTYSAQSSREIQLNKSSREIKITEYPFSLAEMANYLHKQNLTSRKPTTVCGYGPGLFISTYQSLPFLFCRFLAFIFG